jgi:hypothetical protein
MDTKTSPVSPKCQRGSSFVVGNMFVSVLVNPLAATPLFSSSSLARVALFGLVVYKPRVRRVAKPKTCRKAPVSGNAPPLPPCRYGDGPSPVTVSARTCQQWQVPLGHGSFRRGA